MATIVNRIYNPITGPFGSGNIMVYAGSTAPSGAQTATTYTWNVPAGVDAVRARLWGGGGWSGGGGGGFALKAIYGLSGTTSVLISVGFGGNSTTTTGGTSSFGSFVSATGGTYSGSGVLTTGGSGSGGDINHSGGSGWGGSTLGGGAASVFGPGASTSANSQYPQTSYGGAGVGAGVNSSITTSGAGFIGSSLSMSSNTSAPVQRMVLTPPGSGLENFSIDFIGTGGGGAFGYNGRNGGGGWYHGTLSASGITGGIPGGGGGGGSGLGAPGMVIVEW